MFTKNKAPPVRISRTGEDEVRRIKTQATIVPIVGAVLVGGFIAFYSLVERPRSQAEEQKAIRDYISHTANGGNVPKDDLRPLTKDVSDLKTNVAGVQTDVAELKTNVAGLKTDVAGLKTDVAGLKTDVATLKTDVAVLKADVTGIKVDIAEIKLMISAQNGRPLQRKTPTQSIPLGPK